VSCCRYWKVCDHSEAESDLWREEDTSTT
jgi:hypothetical protein